MCPRLTSVESDQTTKVTVFSRIPRRIYRTLVLDVQNQRFSCEIPWMEYHAWGGHGASYLSGGMASRKIMKYTRQVQVEHTMGG